ncbi:MAG: SDR family oxidoreductase [Nitrospirae bacterium]|nr:SDR family oxidoreductase [Candidatus Manganitrophaceae bacterium]
MSTILVVGATGNVGREVVAQLLAKGEVVRAATRNPDTAKLPKGASAVQVSLEQKEDLGNALAGADQVFLLAPADDLEPDKTVARVVEESKTSGIDTIVLMTALGAEQSNNPFSRAERIVSESGLRHTFIRPNWFMQNFSFGLFAQSIRDTGDICLPAADAKVSFVDTRDIAAMAVASLTESGHEGHAYNVTGGRAMTHSEVADIISKVSRKSVSYTSISDDDLRASFAKEGTPEPLIEQFVSLFQPMRDGLDELVSPDVSRVLGRLPITFEQHAQEFADCWRG